MRDLIINGTFDSGSANWGGTDLETSYTENAYLGNGSSNRVAEMDGQSGQTTVMEQSFTVNNPIQTTLTLDAALRTASLNQAGTEGFTVEILDAGGAVIASMSVLPTTNSFTQASLNVVFPSGGQYMLRLTELGSDNSLGAVVDNISLMVCFCNGTLIETVNGPRAIETLAPGDMVLTENGPTPLRWIGKRSVSPAQMAENTKLCPVRIEAGALSPGLPSKPLQVSRQHRMLIRSRVAQRMFGQFEVLIPAIRLTALPGIYVNEDRAAVTYYHMLFDNHEIVFANGAPSESLLVTEQSLAALSPAAQEELKLLFPDLICSTGRGTASARPIPPRARQKRLVARIGKNNRAALDAI
ncbi:Hint domain-containing protein [Phaeobacter sp. HS012]|nr:Hint domain-containing protein [Phaeobacter sp. HS011]MBQ4806367.1 Hint domain-containing protein [Phaeobacter sp. HS012]MBQ4881217.1 Hint domain-containing protein [Phaeobacter sp. HS011]